ncbi:MAG: TonB-dependent receptor [Candidatus Andeanibacterium colombiense]|uniref:TonB-dependent receptor n=1 Tax=Candidatus Andeanibacterium colombiense TaxID=3121345 RepID=A0AAJ6BLB1_9SPHN|nr:MAG: TonB-dependent receptor [Sphingomonadaceae bacterium]
MIHREGNSNIRTWLLALSAASTLALAAGVAAPAAAQAQEQKIYEFDVAAQPLGKAITRIAAQAGLQVLYNDDGPANASAPAVIGRMTVEQALGRALAGTGYTFQYVRPGVITLRAVSAAGNADGEKVTAVVSVEGVTGSPYFGGAGRDAGVNGVNGSRDITATEGTGSFTSGALTIGSKVPQALKDVPQSISLLTNERLEQQNITDFTTAMKQLPGISFAQGGSNLETTFYSRGFAVTSLQVDGGAPLETSAAAVWGMYPQIDMSIYDHVELLRGAAGQFGSYGDPGGTVNLVRKKPLDHDEFSIEAQVGSWQNYRLVADATAPLALDGRLRGRLVVTYQDNHYFYDIAKSNKTLIYGIAEFDLTPTTLVSAGVDYTRQDSLPWQGGLPRYLDGGDLKLPRSTCLCFDWNRWTFDTTDIFGSIEQKIGDDWTFKLNLTRTSQSVMQKIGYSQGGVNPTNLLGPVLNGFYQRVASKQFSAEATLAGAFTLFDQRQEITAGVNRVKSDAGGTADYDTLISSSVAAPYQPYPGGPIFYYGSPNGLLPPINVFGFDPADPLYTEPRNPLRYGNYPEFGTVQTGAYINLRLTAFDRLHLDTGLRWTRYRYARKDEYLCTTTTDSCAGLQIGDVYDSDAMKYGEHDFSWPPPVNVSFDLTKQLTAYVGYTDIYRSQSFDVDANLKPVDPVTGSNWELGLKWAARGGKLNLSLAAYDIKQKGFAMPDPPDYSNYYTVAPGVYCCFVTNSDGRLRSKGIDLEASGEIARGWQFSGSYTYNENRAEGTYFGIDADTPVTPIVTIAPKHLYKLWTSYDFGAAGRERFLSGLRLSLGVNGQSSGFNSGRTCVRLNDTVAPNPITGAQPCLPDGYEDYAFVVPAYAVVSGRIDYRLSDKWSLALNLDNIFDKIYYQSTGTAVTRGNWYGTPRSFTASLRAKW